ncbi:MAG: hypothetical protein SOZ95_00310 [Bacilli bacterium]|nr:hypothetical protein [Bacilli bacterium]
MLYLSCMVIDKKYQGKNISQEIIKSAFKQVNSDLISLRTQNIAMARSLLNLFFENLFEMPSNVNKDILKYLRKIEPFKNINEFGIIKHCYTNQLYYDLSAIKNNFNLDLTQNDVLAVVIKPNKNKEKNYLHDKNYIT